MIRTVLANPTLFTLNVIAAVALVFLLTRHHFRASDADSVRSAGLERPVTNLQMDGTPLIRVLHELQRQTGAQFVLSPSIATRVVQAFHGMVNTGPGWQTPIWGSFHEVTLGEALDVLCRHARFAAPLHYDVLPDGRIFLGADDEMPQVVRIYDVRNLTTLMPNPQTDSFIEDDIADEGPVRQLETILPQTDGDRDGIRIEPRWWLVNGRLVVVASRRAQRRIARELEALQDIHESFPPGSPFIARNGGDLLRR